MATRKRPAKKTVTKKKGATRRKTVPKAAAGSRLLTIAPDELPITERRAKYLAEEAHIEPKKLVGRKLKDVHELVKWKISPELLLFRRVCGRVVKKDPVTGQFHPVPNATVHVEDTDCSFWGFFPVESPFVWLYPLFCSREEIAAVRTDECGKFCVYLPYWDIDRILRFRRRRICYLDFYRPILRDLLELLREPPELRVPRPIPDPPPFQKIRSNDIERVRDLVAPELIEELEIAADGELSSASQGTLEDVLEQPAFPPALPPPLPKEMLAGESSEDGLAEAMSFSLDRKLLKDFNVRRFIGPFLRCFDIFVPEWTPILDVPDITFRVTQDYDFDGVEEEIYSESFFDVRWNAPSILNVTLEASGSALSVEHCRPVIVPCGNKASIESAGYLDIEPGYHDNATGYGKRVNRPTNHGWYPGTGDGRGFPANAPYAGNVNLHGCFRLKNATHYRVLRSFRDTEFDPWGLEAPIMGVTWTAPRQGPGAPIPMVPNADGWYPVHPAGILVHPNWILPWRTWTSPGDGGYRLRLQLGRQVGAAINVVDTSASRVFEVDNSRPESSFIEVRWRDAAIPGAWTNANSTVVLPPPLAGTCPIIYRPTGMDIHVRVVWSASSKHFRDAILDQWGCGGGGMERVDIPPVPATPPAPAPWTIPGHYRHWHTGPLNNAVNQTNVFLLRGARPPGCYTVRIRANSRAYNPQDWDAASTMDWWKDQVFKWRHRSRAISVVDV